MKDGRRFSRPPDPYTPAATPQGQINEHQIVIAAEVMTVGPRLRPPRTDARRRPTPTPSAIIEPVFANTKFNRRIDRFHRRGRSAARTEWRLITATHNLLKLHKHHTATATA
jgi:hypothetical protein